MNTGSTDLLRLPDHVSAADRAAIEAAWSGHYPDAVALLLYGSVLRGEATDQSDIDLFVVLPEGDELHERRLVKAARRVQCTAVPVNALPFLAEISRRTGRMVGLIGLASGRLIHGDLPGLDALQAECRSALAEVNARMQDMTAQNLRVAVETAQAAIEHTGPGGVALGLRAVPMLLELALRQADEAHKATRSQYRRQADRHPEIVEAHARIAAAVAAGDMQPLAEYVAELAQQLPPDPPNLVTRRLSLRQLLRAR